MKPSVTAAAGCDIPGLLVRGIQGNRTNKRHFISISIYLSISISICLFIYMLAVGLVTNSCLTLVTPQTVARQAPLPMGFSRQGYWSGLPFPAPGDLPDPGIKPESPALAGVLYRVTWEACCAVRWHHITEFWPYRYWQKWCVPFLGWPIKSPYTPSVVSPLICPG